LVSIFNVTKLRPGEQTLTDALVIFMGAVSLGRCWLRA
jgi:hypothetical protein